MYLAMFSKTQGRIIVEFRFVENVGSARHIQPLSNEEEEEGDVLLSDSCAMSCSDRLW